MKKYKVFCRADKKGKKWQEYSGIYDRKEDAADCLLIATNHKTMNENGDLIIYKVEEIETEENASRSPECVCYTPIQAEVYEQVKAAWKADNTGKLNEVRNKYGYDIYKWAIDELNVQEENLIEILWNAACSGNIGMLEAYFKAGGKVGRRYFVSGIAYSLILGALRNGKVETVKYLCSVGETVEMTEKEEFKSFCMENLTGAAENLVDYAELHNKHIANGLNERINNIKGILDLIHGGNFDA